MGLCSLRTFFLTNCVIQLICTTWRQVFDFLGYMWGPILANFIQIIFVIFGFFGAYQYRPKYTIAYTIWCVFWCCWNVFVTCFYLNAFGLDKESDWLSVGTGSVNWWEVNGPGCKPVYLANLSSPETSLWRPLRPDFVNDCLVLYHHLEAAQAILHLIMGTAGLISGIAISWTLLDEDDSSPSCKKKKADVLPPLYSIEYSMRHTAHDADDLSVHELPEDPESRLSSPRPMTPRRVKRRSVNSRGLPPQRTGVTAPMTQYYSSQRHSSQTRSSTRSSQRRQRSSHQNPVTRLIDQQQRQDGSRLVGHTNPLYQQSSSHSLDQECERPSSARSVYSNYHGTRAFSYTGIAHSPPSTFLSRGPPAYNLHSPNKTETVI